MTFNTALLHNIILPLSDASCFWVAYSGGCDSHVLLHAMASLRLQLKLEIRAIHINHGLSPYAKKWEQHCCKTCEALAIPYITAAVNATAINSSPEEAARLARYAQWHGVLKKNEILLLAHHQDDQAETLLLQLMRGAGVKGLAAMPAAQVFSQGQLCRPLLTFSRQELHEYARVQGLNWIDDPSNANTDLDRNFLRHDVIPLMQSRWPSLNKTLSRSASHMAEADKLLSEQARQDWLIVADENLLHIPLLIELDEARQRNLLRYWLGFICGLTLPDTRHLQRILDEVIPAAVDAKPRVSWRGAEVRRFNARLYASSSFEKKERDQVFEWLNFSQPLVIDHAGVTVIACQTHARGLSQQKLQGAKISIRFRQGGERCRPMGRGQRHQLKKLFQEWRVPPWQRAAIPLLFVGDELAQVIGYCLCEPFVAVKKELGWLIKIQSNS